MARTRLLGFCLVLLGSVPTRSSATTFVVNSTADDAICDASRCTLRGAITAANQNAGPDRIEFAIANGAQTIVVTSPLPDLSDTVTIDGTTQPGYAGAPLVFLDGSSPYPVGLHVTSDGTVIRALALGGFTRTQPVRVTAAIYLDHVSNARVELCYIGTDLTGTAARPNEAGIFAEQGGSNSIGGPGVGNLVSGNTTAGIVLSSSHSVVAGNRVGTNAAGTVALPNETGIAVLGTGAPAVVDVLVGGTDSAASNLVSGNRFVGISLGDPDPTGPSDMPSQYVVLGNRIGTDVSGSSAIANGIGVRVGGRGYGHRIGGGAPGDGNVIAFNGTSDPNYHQSDAGVQVDAIGHAQITGNSIHDNAGLGIDLVPNAGGYGVTPNDPSDADAGGNDLQNFPVLTSASMAAGQTHVIGSLQSAASTTFHVEFFSNPACDPSGNGEGQYFLGSSDVPTDGNGDASIDVVLPATAQGPWITATATDPAGNTSEFSACVALPGPVLTAISPTSGPASGGTTITLTGMRFQSSVTVSIGPMAAGNPTDLDDQHATAVTPSLAAGALYDVTLTNADGLSGTLPKGWLADFSDVPGSHPFHALVEKLVRARVTAGCGGGNYCVDDAVTRAQVAVFLLRSKEGPTYNPPAATGTVFADVPASGFSAAWIEELAHRQVVAGCGGGNYCPTSPVTRAQMSVFLLRTKYGSTYAPPSATGIFADVPASSPFAPWVEELYHEGATAGCGGGNYCPDAPSTRGQMAVFLVTTFGL